MGNTGEDIDASSPIKIEKKKKKKIKNTINDGDTHVEIHNDDLLEEKVHKHTKKKKKSVSNQDIKNDNLEEDNVIQKKHKKKRKRDSSEETQTKEDDNDPKPKKEKKKKKKSNENEDGGEKGNFEDNGDLQKKKKKKSKKDSSENTEKPKKKKTKKVTFSGEVEIFPPPNTKKPQKTKPTDNLVRGKRFTPEEDEIVKQAVENYIISNNLGDDGLQMILNCKSHKGMKKCWQEIGTCIPYRPYVAIYSRAHILFEQSELRQWTPEEIQFLKESHKKHGNKWRLIADDLGKHRFHVKDKWRRIKFENLKNGRWSQDEYQGLYDLVNLDLQMKVNGQEKKSKHGMLRDNIPWTSISEKLSTRSDSTCCKKWYEQLTSSLVSEKKWLDADDYWLVGRLYEIDAACAEDVDWDNVLDHRDGETCRKRWDQMVVCIGGNYRSKTFGEQVEILAKRYRPELAEARQTWDDKPVVP